MHATDYSCQNVTFLEITCHSSIVFFPALKLVIYILAFFHLLIF